MPVIARDAVAADHLVYAWPFPIGPDEYEVACAEDELVVMCPAWMVGDRLGPGRHRWRTHDPSRPVSAYFVLTAPVEVSFDMITSFVLPTNGQPVRLRANGSLQIRCMDPALLVAQFVGLPFDNVNDGVLRSVSRSIERMLARLLTRRVVMAGTSNAVTDPSMLQGIVEELVAYNPAAGAVFGVELVRFGHLAVVADDGSRPWQQMQNLDWSGNHPRVAPPNGDTQRRAPAHPDIPLLETVRAPRPGSQPAATGTPPSPTAQATGTPPPASRATQPTSPAPLPSILPSIPPKAGSQSSPGGDGRPGEASGEIVVKTKRTAPGHAAAPSQRPTVQGMAPVAPAANDITPSPQRVVTTPVPPSKPRRAGSIEVPQSTDEITEPGVDLRTVTGEINTNAKKTPERPPEKQASSDDEPRGSILGIGMSHIGSSSAGVASGEISQKIAPGGRVLVPGPNGLMQSATVRQLLQGYYELEVGGSGETIWVPINGVVPE